MCDALTCDGLPIGTDAQDTVVSFAYLPEESLRALHENLSLGMCHSQLCSCSSYYRTIRRDPSVDELRLIDAYLTSCSTRAAESVTLSSLTTPDGEIAAMLASLIEQSKTAQGMTRPLTLASALEASHTVSQGTALAGIGTGARVCFVTDENYGALTMKGLIPEQSVCIGEGGVRLTLAHNAKAHKACPPHTGELIGLLRLPEQTDEAYFARLHSFLSDEGNRGRIRGFSVCPRGELLALLISLCPNGCYADLSVLCRGEHDAPLFETAAQVKGYLVRAGEKDMKELLSLLRASGLDMTVFARLCNDGTLTVAERDAVRAAVPITLLCSLLRTRAVSLELYPSSLQAVTSPLPTSLNGGAIALGPYTLVHTTLPLHDALSPYDVKQALMRCAQELTAAGSDTDSACAAVSLCVGTQSSQCALWSAVLGLYSTLNDWKWPSLPPIVKNGAEPMGALTVCLFARTR